MHLPYPWPASRGSPAALSAFTTSERASRGARHGDHDLTSRSHATTRKWRRGPLALAQAGPGRLRLGDPPRARRADARRGARRARLGVEAALALGSGFWRIGDTETALSVIEKEIERAFRLGDRELLAAVHRVLGVSLSEIGGHVAGVQTLERAFGFALESGAPRAICECANSLGTAIFASCRNADAETKADALSNTEAMIRTALDVANEANDLPSVAAAESSLGAVIIERGDWVEGRMWAARALDKTRSSGDLLAEGYALVSLAVCDRELGALDPALSSLEQAYAIGAAQKAKPLLRAVHLQVSQTLERSDRFADALVHYKRHHQLEREIAADIAEQRARMSTLRLDRERARRDVERFRAETQALSDVVDKDALTGIGNRRAFDRALAALLGRGRGRGPCTLALIDCDHFNRSTTARRTWPATRCLSASGVLQAAAAATSRASAATSSRSCSTRHRSTTPRSCASGSATSSSATPTTARRA